MDPLSITASVIAIIQLSSEVVGFIGSAAGASKTRRLLREEIQACDKILQDIKDEADDSEEGKAWSEKIRVLEYPDGPLSRLSIALRLVKAKLEPKDGQKKVLTALKWPFEEKEVQKIIDAIEREKKLLLLALENNHRKLVQSIQRSAKDHQKQLLELIEAVKDGSKKSQDSLAKLGDEITQVVVSQDDLKDGIDRLRLHDDHREATEAYQEILEWLTPVDYAAQHSDFINRQQQGTGGWLIDSEEYRTWVQTPKTTLFCPGIPGAGKTILTAITIDDLFERFQGSEDTAIAYVYCNFRQQNEQTVDNMLASLLKQLSEKRASPPASLTALYEQHKAKHTRPSFDEISKTLQVVTAIYSRVFVVINTLDKTSVVDGCQTRLLTELFKVQASSEANVFVTSRHIPNITSEFNKRAGCTSLEIHAREEDMRRYLDSHIDRLPSFARNNSLLQEEILSKIVQSVQGMFLLAQLYLKSLGGKRSPKAVRTALANLPSGSGAKAYDFAYQDAMARIDGQLEDQTVLAKQVLAWITLAKRPLTPLELQNALAVEFGTSELDTENLPQIEDMISVCAGLVTIDEESRIIRLVHYTTQEYFERPGTQQRWFPDAQAEITTVCVTYLSYNAFESGFCKSDDAFEKRLLLNPFYDYAAHHWGSHAREAATLPEGVMEFLTDVAKVEASSQTLLASSMRQWGPSYKYSQRVPQQVVGLHLAAYFGVQEAGHILLQASKNVDVCDSYSRTPLSWAADSGHEAVVRLLLDRGAEIEAKDSDGRTPLLWAADSRDEAVIQLLLDRGADIEAKDIDGWTPLLWAADSGDEAVIRLLLNRGADIEAKDSISWTPLLQATNNRNKAVMQLLLDRGADIEAKDSDGWTPLWQAAYRRHEAVMQLLLDRGADVEAKDSDGWTPLLWAASRGHEAVVQLLLDRGADIEAKDSCGRTLLQLAVFNGHDIAEEILVSRGACIEDFYGLRGLFSASI
ncbi:uncharacterized protein E0L32_010666 [Thyridium curvatum]|uniref:Uncharacterized protein n=1 Tax=Thyridium curvatum TaxID=1093900 RepID=A0A507AS23_9PEZI|nr:uncharacterized protein E0L32_010666 [Thyridium curvatum]TPX07668.1 hypothetical protein E0L32_010666 [Thyridium curvatum]